jgi:hypothetical protein
VEALSTASGCASAAAGAPGVLPCRRQQASEPGLPLSSHAIFKLRTASSHDDAVLRVHSDPAPQRPEPTAALHASSTDSGAGANGTINGCCEQPGQQEASSSGAAVAAGAASKGRSSAAAAAAAKSLLSKAKAHVSSSKSLLLAKLGNAPGQAGQGSPVGQAMGRVYSAPVLNEMDDPVLARLAKLRVSTGR